MRRTLILYLLLLGLVGCQDDSWVLRTYGPGWPGYRGDSVNSGHTDRIPAQSLALQWSRPLFGQVYAQPSVSSHMFVGVTARTDSGCNTFSFDAQSGRKRWCLRRFLGTELASPLVDQFDTVYLGEAGRMTALAQNGSVKWSVPVLGMPVASSFTRDGNILVATHLGQIQVVNAINGRTVSPPIELIAVEQRADASQGLSDCAVLGPGCPLSSPPTYDPNSGRIVVSFWPPGAAAAQLVGMRYTPDDGHLWLDWRHSANHPGSLGLPVSSRIGSTVLCVDGGGFLTALNTEDGSLMWQVDTHMPGTRVAAWGPSQTVVLGASLQTSGTGELMAFQQEKLLWHREDVHTISPVTLVGSQEGLVLISSPDNTGSAVLRFAVETGQTLSITEFPQLRPSYSPGISLGPTGQVVFALDGHLVVADRAKQR